MSATRVVLASEITLDDVQAAIGDLRKWAHQCHAGSLALVRSGILGEGARVARGWLPGIPGQHSWATIGDPYAKYGAVIDVTRWSYEDVDPYVWRGTRSFGGYAPHGVGHIVDFGKPTSTGEEPIALTPKTPLSVSARAFLRILGPLDRRGWMALASAPVGGWPAGEILAAMDDTAELSALIPVDKLGMATDRNPGGLYR
jgi:hypothetical protein